MSVISTCTSELADHSGGVWINFDGHILTKLDENYLIHNNDKLNDRHINLTQGLGYTLLQNKPLIKNISSALQIIFWRKSLSCGIQYWL